MQHFLIIGIFVTVLAANSVVAEDQWNLEQGILEDMDFIEMLKELQPPIKETIVKSGFSIQFEAKIKLLQLQISPIKTQDQKFAQNAEKVELKRAILDLIDFNAILQNLQPVIKETITMNGFNIFFVTKIKLQKLRVSPATDQVSTPTPTQPGIVTTEKPDIETTLKPGIVTTKMPDILTTLAPTEMLTTEGPLPTFPTITDSDIKDLMSKCGDYYRGDIDGVKKMMIKFGPKQIGNAKTPGGSHWTCLHFAASSGYPNIITLLIENGADLDPKETNGETPLRIAIRFREYSSITTLIKLGADLEKAKVANYGQNSFDSIMREEKTKAAIAEGQRLAGQIG